MDSLMWLGIAGILTALLMPIPRQHFAVKRSPKTADKKSPRKTDASNPKARANGALEQNGETPPGPYYQASNIEYFPSTNEFFLQNEADFIAQQNAPPAAPSR
jgi:hypothetical protein